MTGCEIAALLPSAISGGVEIFRYGKTKQRLADAVGESNKLRGELADKDKTIAKKEETIAEQRAIIAEQTTQINAVQQMLDSTQQQHDEANKKIESLLNLLWGSGAVIIVLLLFLLFSSVTQG